MSELLCPCCLLQSLQYLKATHILTSVCPLCSVSQCPLLFSTFSALYVSTSFFRLSVLCHYVHCCLLPPVHSPSVRDTEVFVVSVSLYPLLLSTVCPLSVSTSYFSVCWYLSKTTAIYILSHAQQYLTPYGFLIFVSMS